MIEGWSRAGKMPDRIVVYDIDKAKADGLASLFASVRVADLAAAAAQDVVIVGLHPPAAGDVLPTLSGHLRRDAILLSLMPKLRFAKLTDMLGGFARDRAAESQCAVHRR